MTKKLGNMFMLALPLAFIPIVHFITYVLASILPNPSTILSGFFGSTEGVKNAFSEQFGVRSYNKIVYDLLHGSFGRSLDNQEITQVVTNSIYVSSKPLILSIALIIIAGVITGFLTQRNNSELPKIIFGYFSFLPIFLPVFLIFVIMLKIAPVAINDALFELLASTISLSIIACSLVALQVHLVTLKILDEPFITTFRAIGASEARCKILISRNIFLETLPTLEKVITSLLGAILLVEPILGINGIGTNTIRAMQRNDVELILAFVLVYSVIVATMRFATRILVFKINKEAQNF